MLFGYTVAKSSLLVLQSMKLMSKGKGKPDWKNAKVETDSVWMVTGKIGDFARHNSFKELGKFREASYRLGWSYKFVKFWSQYILEPLDRFVSSILTLCA